MDIEPLAFAQATITGDMMTVECSFTFNVKKLVDGKTIMQIMDNLEKVLQDEVKGVPMHKALVAVLHHLEKPDTTVSPPKQQPNLDLF